MNVTERYYVTLVNRLRSNHYNLNASLARKSYIESERCECGYEIENIDHVVWRCHRFDEQRMRLGEKLERRTGRSGEYTRHHKERRLEEIRKNI